MRHGLDVRTRLIVTSAVVGSAGVLAVAAGVKYGTGVFDVRTTLFVLVAFGLALLGTLSARFAVVAVVLAVLFSALLRRVFPAVDAAADPAAVTPFVVMLPLAVRALLRRTAPAVVLVALAVFAVSAARTPGNGIPAYAALALPILAGLTIRADRVLWADLVRWWSWLAPLAFGYGLYQLFDTPSWDVAWITNSGFNSVGQAGEESFRPFATFPAAGAAALTAVLTLLIAATTIGSPHVKIPVPLRVLNVVLAVAFLAAASVRSAWLWGAVALLVALMSGASRRANLAVLPVVMIGVVAVSQIPAIASKFLDRAGTLTDLSSDKSFQARSGSVLRVGDLLSVFGGGLGTGQNASGTSRAIDNGYLIVLAENGLIGVIALALLVWGVVRHVERQYLAFPVFWLLADLTGYNWDNTVGFLVVSMTVLTVGGRGEDPPPDPTADLGGTPEPAAAPVPVAHRVPARAGVRG